MQNLFAMLGYDFMRKAFIVGILLAVVMPCIGMVSVLKRLSMIGDALSHTSLAGVAAGLILGVNPLIGAMAVCLAAAFSIEAVRKRIPRYSEMSIAIIMSAGIGTAGVLSGFVEGANFNSFLFGSIIAITSFEVIAATILGIAVIIIFLLLYKELFLISFDERGARLSGVRVALVNSLFTILTAITVSIAARIVGALVVSSLMVIPVACGMQVSKSYKTSLISSIAFAVSFTVVGLSLSFFLDFRPGATIVLVGVAVLVILLVYKSVFGERNNKSQN